MGIVVTVEPLVGFRRRMPLAGIAVVALAVRANGNTADFQRALLNGGPWNDDPTPASLLDAVDEAVRGVRLSRDRTALIVPAVGSAGGPHESQVVAGQVAAHLDLAGPLFTVPTGVSGGLDALTLAARALRDGACDDVLVACVDPTAGTAVAFVLGRLADARRDGARVLAVAVPEEAIPPAAQRPLTVALTHEGGVSTSWQAVEAVPGCAGEVAGLVGVAAAVVALRCRVVPVAGRPMAPTSGLRAAEVVAGGRRVRLDAGEVGRWSGLPAPRLVVFSGRDRAEVLAAARAGTGSNAGPARLAVVIPGGDDVAAVRRACEWLAGRGPRPAGAAYRDRPVGGEVGFVYVNGAAAYPGMGRELLLALPDLSDRVRARYGVAPLAADPQASPTVVDSIVETTRLAVVHTEVTTGLLRLRPDAAIGYSSGETSALVALRAWPDAAELERGLREDSLFTRDVAGGHRALRAAWARAGIAGSRWATHVVQAPVDQVRNALANESAVRLMTVNAPDVCVVGGEEEACAQWLGRTGVTAVRVGYDLAAHVPELAGLTARWRDFHRRRTHPVPGVRFYSGVTRESYSPTTDRAADAITAMATRTVDFAGTVEAAYADGVRVFVEHGPRGLCTGWIKRTLRGRDHVAVCLDAPEGGAVRRLCSSVAELVAAGVAVDHEALFGDPARADVTSESTDALAPHDLRGAVEHRRRVALAHRQMLTSTGEAHAAFLRARERAHRSLRDIRPPAKRYGAGVPVVEHESVVGADDLDPAGRMRAAALVARVEGGARREPRTGGAELIFHGALPRPGDVLRCETAGDTADHPDSYRRCRVGDEAKLTVRAGKPLPADDPGTGAWDPVADPPETARVDRPVIEDAPRTYDEAAVRRFAQGDPAACFGPRWSGARSHVRTPSIPDGPLREVVEFTPDGGPWRRGYLRAEGRGDALDGCLQAMAFYLAALGHTLDRDGWRFEPEPDRPFRMWRGAATGGRSLVHEVFVVSVTAAPVPTLVADVVCSAGGVPVLRLRGIGLRLVPDWPLDHWRLGPRREQTTDAPVPPRDLGGLGGHEEDRSAAVVDGVRVGWSALVASAWGRTSEAFGPRFADFDGVRRCPRLPGPPYLFMSRVVAVEGPVAGMRPGSRVTAEYDVPDDAWYFGPGQSTMPFAVLLEAAMQPCGWLATYVGSTLGREGDLLFRNLDGHGTVLGEVGPRTRTLRTVAELRSTSAHGETVIQSFDVECSADGQTVFTLRAVFGFFPPTAFVDQPGLPPSAEDEARLVEPGEPGPLRAPATPPMLRMVDRVTGYWPEGGRAGLGRVRAERDIRPEDWYFRAHFFQDPVQPGSLGITAACLLLQHHLVASGRTTGLSAVRFEPIMTGRPVAWKFRGQVVPGDSVVTTEVEVTEAGTDERGPYVIGDAWLWVDGRRIYHVVGLGMRALADEVFSLEADGWLADHRPTWTVPVLPGMSAADLIARAVDRRTGEPVTALRDVRLHRWLRVDEPLRTRTEVDRVDGAYAVTLFADDIPAVTGVVDTGSPARDRPEPFPPLPDARTQPDPYDSGALFHGEAFHYLTELRVGPTGASATLDAGAGRVPRGLLHQGLLDGALHTIPHQELWRWSAEVDRDRVALPRGLDWLRLFEPLPESGPVTVEARFAGFSADDRKLPRVDLQLGVDGRVVVDLRLVMVLLPIGRLSSLRLAERCAFLRDRLPCDGAGLSVTEHGVTRVRVSEVVPVDWPPGTVAAVYGLPPGADPRAHLAEIAVKDHLARRAGVHPGAVVVEKDLRTAYPSARPWERYAVEVRQGVGAATVRSPVDEAAEADIRSEVEMKGTGTWQVPMWSDGSTGSGSPERSVWD